MSDEIEAARKYLETVCYWADSEGQADKDAPERKTLEHGLVALEREKTQFGAVVTTNNADNVTCADLRVSLAASCSFCGRLLEHEEKALRGERGNWLCITCVVGGLRVLAEEM